MAAQESLMASHNVMQVQGYSDRRSCYETLIERPKLMAKLVDAVYDMNEDPEREDEVLRRVWKELGYSRMQRRANARKPWCEVFVKDNKRCRYSSAYKVVIAVRGTDPTSVIDWKSNIRITSQTLHLDDRYYHLQDLVEDLVGSFSNRNVAIAGHSMGAGLALMVGKFMAKTRRPIDAFLFNPPFPSFDIICSPELRKMEKGCKAMLLGIYTFLGAVCKGDRFEKLAFSRDQEYRSVGKWAPHLFLNKGDIVNLGYVHQVIDKLRCGDKGFMARLSNWLAPHTLLSLVIPGVSPSHLPPSFSRYTIADTEEEPHALKRWYEDPVWKSGREVRVLEFGRQVDQPLYNLQRGYIRLQFDKFAVPMMIYTQTTESSVEQLLEAIRTDGSPTTKQKQIMFMFNTEQDAQKAQRDWPARLRYRDINDFIRQSRSFEFLLQKLQTSAVTFYIYAVKHREDPFQQELEWKFVGEHFTSKVHEVTDWIKVFYWTARIAKAVLDYFEVRT